MICTFSSKFFILNIGSLNTKNKKETKALKERRPPWPTQLITPVLRRFLCRQISTVIKFQALGEHRPPPRPDRDPNYYQNLTTFFLTIPNLSIKVHLNPFITCLSNVTNRQRSKQSNQCCWKHNLLCQGGNKMEVLGSQLSQYDMLSVHKIYEILLYTQKEKSRCNSTHVMRTSNCTSFNKFHWISNEDCPCVLPACI